MSDSNLLKKIDEVRFNPSAIQRVILENLETKLNGEVDIVDATNPFVFLLEASTVNASAAMSQSEALTRQQYPSLSQTEEELYLHMADADYVGRFANPSSTVFTILLGLDELYSRAVETGVGNVRKLVIPRHTEFTISDYKFTMQYPIEIRIMGHGGLQIVYDADLQSPLQSLETNIVDWMIVDISGTEFIKIDIPVSQFEIVTQYDQLNSSTGYNRDYNYNDQFYYCRVYVSQPNGSWREIHTTHTEQVYDPTRLTAVLKVQRGLLNVHVPQIYFTTGMAQREIRVDIYTTKGRLDLILGNYAINNFTVRWRDLDSIESSVYTAPLSSYSTMAVYSDRVVSGGTEAITFEALRDRVIRNALGSSNLPITGVQLETVLTNRGYDIVKDVDNITKRIYLATRSLPSQGAGALSSGAGASITTLQITLDQLRDREFVKNNGDRVTLLPDNLYEQVDGVLELVPRARQEALGLLGIESRANEVNSSGYMYSPFYYVLDVTGGGFSCRPYYLDDPKVDAKTFVAENDTVGLEVASGNYTLERVESGYKLTVVTRSGKDFKELDDSQVHVQLSFKPVGESDHAFINGVPIGKVDEERVYEFYLDTDYDIDDRHNLFLTNFKLYDTSDRLTASRLVEDFNILYAVSDYSSEGLESSDIDLELGKFLIMEDSLVGVAHERFRMRLGVSLEGLWSNSRSVVSSISYERYEADEPWYYETDVYQRDPVTGALDIQYDSTTGEIVYTLLHSAGDPVLDEHGNQLYRYRKGDVKTDVDGSPIAIEDRGVLRQIDLFLVDGVYRYATEDSSVVYRENIAKTIVGWVTEDIAEFNRSLLEQTKLYFYPKTTLGDINVYINEGLTSTIASEQSFHVKYYMNRTAFDSLELRAPLTQTAISVIAEVLRKPTISLTEMSSKISAIAGNDILGVEVTGLGGEARLTTVTVKDSSANCTIKKRLQPTPDGKLAVVDDVFVEFIRHVE